MSGIFLCYSITRFWKWSLARWKGSTYIQCVVSSCWHLKALSTLYRRWLMTYYIVIVTRERCRKVLLLLLCKCPTSVNSYIFISKHVSFAVMYAFILQTWAFSQSSSRICIYRWVCLSVGWKVPFNAYLYFYVTPLKTFIIFPCKMPSHSTDISLDSMQCMNVCMNNRIVTVTHFILSHL